MLPRPAASHSEQRVLASRQPKFGAAGSHGRRTEAKTRVSGKCVFTVEYRSFKRHVRLRSGRIGRLRGYGPQGDRTFGTGEKADDDVEVHTELISEPFSDNTEIDDGEERFINRDDVSEKAADSAR